MKRYRIKRRQGNDISTIYFFDYIDAKKCAITWGETVELYVSNPDPDIKGQWIRDDFKKALFDALNAHNANA